MTTIATAKKTKCWFEYNAGTFGETIARGYPDRIWTVDDERWKTIVDARDPRTQKPRPVNGTVIQADVDRVGDELFPRKFVHEHSIQCSAEKGLELMKLFAETGTVVALSAKGDEWRLAQERDNQNAQSVGAAVAAGLAPILEKIAAGAKA